MTLQEQYAAVVQKYLDAFLIKHHFHENGILYAYNWVGDEPGGVVEIADYFFCFDDIRLDVDHEAPKELIFEYYYFTLEYPIDKQPAPNYRAWLMGWRPEMEKDNK